MSIITPTNHPFRRVRFAAVAVLVVLSLVVAMSPAMGDVSSVDASAVDAGMARGGSSTVTLTVNGLNVTQSTRTNVMLVLDESGSMSATEFEQERAFARDMVDALAGAGLFTGGGRMSVAMFDHDARLVLGLASGTSATIVKNALNSVVQQGGQTCLSCAVRISTSQLATDLHARRIAIIATDGAATIEQADLGLALTASNNFGNERFVVGVGNATDPDELALIATDPDATHLFPIADFAGLSAGITTIVAAVDRPAATGAEVHATMAPEFVASDLVTSHGTASNNAGVIEWDIGSLGDETATLTYTATHDGSLDCGPVPVHDSVSYADNQGATGVTFPTVTFDVTGCPAAVAVTPGDGTPQVNTSHGLTATVTDDYGDPVEGATVDFSVLSGPHTGSLGNDVTDALGAATVSYTGTAAGVDNLLAGTEGVTGSTTVAWQQPAWPWSGFKAPVNNLPTVNTVKAGSAVPVKFSVGGNRGLAIFAPGSPSSQATNCETGDPTDAIESTVAAGQSTLTYDQTADTYTYVWKTAKTWKGCRTLNLQLADGGEHQAAFQFK